MKRTRNTLRHLEIVGGYAGLLGAGLLALKLPVISGYGFLAFLVSNACWIQVAWRRRMTELLIMQLGFTVTSAIGLWRWLT